MTSLDFSSLAPMSEEVLIPGEFLKPPRQGVVKFVLREASESAKKRYDSAGIQGMEVVQHEDSKMRVMRNLTGSKDAEPLLVSLCLFEVLDGSTGQQIVLNREVLVTLEFVLSLPARIFDPLFNRLREISGLDKKERDVDPTWIRRARRDLSEQHSVDRGGDLKIMQGINIALDWLKKHVESDTSDNGDGLIAGQGVEETDPKNLLASGTPT